MISKQNSSRIYPILLLVITAINPVIALPNPPDNYSGDGPWYLGYSEYLPEYAPLKWNFITTNISSTSEYIDLQTRGWPSQGQQVTVDVSDNLDDFNIQGKTTTELQGEKQQYFDIYIDDQQMTDDELFGIYVKDNPDDISSFEESSAYMSGPSINMIVPVREIFINGSEGNYFAINKFLQDRGPANASYESNVYCFEESRNGSQEIMQIRECIHIGLGVVTEKYYKRVDADGLLELNYSLLAEELPIDQDLQIGEYELRNPAAKGLEYGSYLLIGLLILLILIVVFSIYYRKNNPNAKNNQELYPKYKSND